jgi:hypothetical protein
MEREIRRKDTARRCKWEVECGHKSKTKMEIKYVE